MWQQGLETGADITVELRGTSLATGDPAVASVSVSPVIKQDTEESTIGLLSLPTDFMHTVRIPLGEFCDAEPLDLTQIDAVAVRLEPSSAARQLLVDSVEFTRGSPDDEIAQCQP